MCIINLKSQNILFSPPIPCSPVLSRCQPPYPFSPSVIHGCRGFIQAICSGGGKLTVTHTHTHKHTHIHELVFSLCPYAVSGVVLLLCCSQTGPFTTAPATRLKQSSPHPTQPGSPTNQLQTLSHTHMHTMAPLSHKATAAGVLLLAPV